MKVDQGAGPKDMTTSLDGCGINVSCTSVHSLPGWEVLLGLLLSSDVACCSHRVCHEAARLELQNQLGEEREATCMRLAGRERTVHSSCSFLPSQPLGIFVHSEWARLLV